MANEAAAPGATERGAVGEVLQIDVWSDVECPWCYVGKHRLDAAIAASPHAGSITIRLHSYQLDPTMSDEAIPNVDRVTAKYCISTTEAARMDGKVAAIAHSDGLPFVADRILANSFDVHRVLHMADSFGVAYELLGVLQHTLFSGEADIFDHATLTEIAGRLDMPRTRVQQVLAGDEYADEVRDDMEQARQLGVTGIPFTVLDGRIAIPGSTSISGYASALENAWESK